MLQIKVLRFRVLSTVLLLVWAVFCWAAAGSAQGGWPQESSEDFFEKNVRPVLLAKCVECHGPDTQEAGLRLDTRANLLQGGGQGPAFEQATPADSLLLRAISYEHELQMPPEGPLASDQVEILRHWVLAGAPWPESVVIGSPMEARVLNNQAEHWAFQPVQRPIVAVDPTVKHPVDYLLQRKLAEKNWSPGLVADERTLVKRAYFTLLGLQPTWEELQAYLNDPQADRWERLIDNLLARPQYGERWARHWLDVARYADTQGYAFAKDRNYPFAYTYRDYVIDAFNKDLPYEQFIRHQLAADQMDLGDDLTPLAALGFLTVGRRFIDYNDTLDDRIDVVTRGLLGLTVSCARCHDHKYDAVSMLDYYALHGVMSSSPDADDKPPIGPRVQVEARQAFERRQRELQRELDEFRNQQVAAIKQFTIDRLPEYFIAVYQPAVGMDLKTSGRGSLSAEDLRPAMVRRWKERLERMTRARNEAGNWFRPLRVLMAIPEKEFADSVAAQLQQWQRLLDQPADGTEDWDVREETATEQSVAGQTAADPSGGSTEEKPRLRLNRRPIPAAVLKKLQAANLQSKRDVAVFYAELLRGVWRTFQEHGANDAAVLQVEEPLRFAIELFRGDSPLNLPVDQIGDFLADPDFEVLQQRTAKLTEHQATAPPELPRAMAVVDRKPPVNSYVFLRGNPRNRGPDASRRFLTVLSKETVPYPETSSGRRELAEQIVSPENPLTARVMVNRVWMHHFGKPLVSTPSDFGVRCEPPLQRELLDFLADYLQRHDWSIKSLHRLILTSHAFRQSSHRPTEIVTADPANDWYVGMNRRRMEWEALRDSMLSAAEQLDTSVVGGPAIDMFRTQDSDRRSIYGTIDRQDLPNLLRSFDFASPDTSIAVRPQTTVPQQSLYLMNGPLVRKLATKIVDNEAWRALADPEQQVQALFRRVLLRSATAEEVDRCLQFLADLELPTETASGKPASPDDSAQAAALLLKRWQMLVQSLMMSNEFCFVD
ncbi:MAG: PSD1 and planctomycete cytochrome C domain-containing protein [Pirellulaceae bacterium]|nr:PSD1 and planctomycete cytochrome C domain-containing protein [Pirellulaceae bacterium]